MSNRALLVMCSKVGEAIEEALQRMGCPYPLQAHQIQGLDYPAVLLVVQWLVKRVLQNREESSDQVSVLWNLGVRYCIYVLLSLRKLEACLCGSVLVAHIFTDLCETVVL